MHPWDIPMKHQPEHIIRIDFVDDYTRVCYRLSTEVEEMRHLFGGCSEFPYSDRAQKHPTCVAATICYPDSTIQRGGEGYPMMKLDSGRDAGTWLMSEGLNNV